MGLLIKHCRLSTVGHFSKDYVSSTLKMITKHLSACCSFQFVYFMIIGHQCHNCMKYIKGKCKQVCVFLHEGAIFNTKNN